MCPARILVADDHDVVRQGLRSLIQEQPQWKIIAEVKDGRGAVAKASELKPDIAILDISMPSLNGLDATKQILKLNTHTKILILSMHDSEQVIANVLGAGARGYILKADAGRDLVLGIQALLAGQTFFTQKAAQIVLDGFTGKRPTPTDGESSVLTAREREVLQLLAEGKINKEVAALLDLSTKTVATHRTNLMRKLSCHCVSELVRYAVRNHLVEA
ncbi:MAG: DNA-binding response regulator [Acidobacteria bacterium]|nr:MAG: DNA-binding response regulator [Acidobacteriota bacterium]